MRVRKIHCFIAIRFGKKDTDAIYEIMAGVVDQIGLKPRRVDRIEHNENINNKILSELKDADIVIADLTYARPSVYYEAGFADRKVPVIYTCRKDHLHNKEDSRKLHFDVDRNNVIFWESSEDLAFKPNLKARLNKVISDLVNLSVVEELRGFLREIKKSSFNPVDLLGRVALLFSQLEDYPIVPKDDSKHDSNLEKRLVIYTEIFNMIDTEFLNEAKKSQDSQWEMLADGLEYEIGQMEKLLEDSNYGETVMYVCHLNNYYKIYLHTMTKLHQRPSPEYGRKYKKVRSRIEGLIEIVQSPFNIIE